MPATFFTSDTHYYHNNIIRYCNRPYGSVEQMNYELIKNHNLVVGNNDVVYMLGDISFGSPDKTVNVLRQLKGHKILIKGNHDTKGKAETVKWHDHFIEVHDYLVRKIDGTKLVLCHFPFHSWERGYVNLHGHTHGTYQSKYMQHDVGVDVNNYTPLLLKDAVSRAIDKKKEGLY